LRETCSEEVNWTKVALDRLEFLASVLEAMYLQVTLPNLE